MFLRSLTLKGFKSFAEPTTLEFEPGVTVVVGPNGSGKSNTVDAVTWVLGAQGPRTVRSGRMDDVIFAGSDRRSPLGRAEVTLTIDNSSGLLPIELSEVTIRRTLFRSSGESEYALNGVPCRLLDVQELLSDTGVGRQQHVIVSQGQLDAVLDARPEDRRMIVEEAAGVLKFRRRKEKAQRRLESTEANLGRLADVSREVRRQLRPLERQAEATRRHGDLSNALRDLRVHLAGRHVAGLRARTEMAARWAGILAGEEAEVRAELIGLDASIASAESRLAAVGRLGLDESAARLVALRERARGLRAVLGERRRSIERDRYTSVDAAVVASLEADATELASELAEVDEASAGLAPELGQLEAAERELAAERAGLQERRASTGAPGPRAAEARGELAALRSAADRDRAERARLANRLAAVEADVEGLVVAATARRADLEEAVAERATYVAARDEAEALRAGLAAQVEVAAAALRARQGERAVWDARVDGLAQALDHSGTSTGHLPVTAGALGTLAELVTVDPGWDAAFEAAVGDAAGAVVVDGVGTARTAVAGRRPDAGPLSLLAVGMPGLIPPRPEAAGGEPLLAHVRAARPDLSAVLESVIGTAVVVDGWEQAIDVALARPDLVVLTRSGDRFSATGWRVGGGGPAAAKVALASAQRRAADAAAAVDAAAGHLASAKEVLATETARVESRARVLADHDHHQDALAGDVERLEAHHREAALTAAAVRAAVADQDARLAQAESRLAALEHALPGLEAEEAAGAAAAAALADERRRLGERADALAALSTELEIRRRGIDQRRQYLVGRLGEVEGRLARAGAEREAASARRGALDLLALRTDRLATVVDANLAHVEEHLADVKARRRQQSEAMAAGSRRLDDLRRRRVQAEQRLEELRERVRGAELEGAEANMRLDAAVETVRRELDVEPETAEASRCPEIPSGSSPESRVRELERELRLLGPVNPLATDELAALREHNAFVESQLEDVKASRRELGRVIRAVDAEIVTLLGAACADVADNFEHLFSTLFPGGQGRLRLTDADSLLETGIDIEARPAGKNVRRLSLLSGGERSLVALAFLFAVFRSRPSPFYLLDEVEAALDDVNLHRFLDLLAEFRPEAQLVVVSHQKRTMEAADCLYGVSMQPGGSSRVISQRVGALTG
ncbi:MAG: chromosome segregation protein SMC [Acidimicrobiales bacterium]